MSMLSKLRDYVLCAFEVGTGPVSVANLVWRQTKNVRVRFGLSRHRPDKIFSVNTRWGRLYFRDNFGDITNLVDLFHHQVYRVDRLDSNGVILDVGANIGLAAAYFVWLNPGRTVHCFEPLGPNASLIGLNCPSAHVHPMAVGASRGQVQLQVDRDSVMASTIPCRWETHDETFEVISLDEFIADNDIEHVALMKIDAEGMESDILSGATTTLERTGQVVMETHGQDRHHHALTLLSDSGFQIERNEFEAGTGIIRANRR